ncbi:uncharacterized protein PHALS_15016 [Plasmopara halstedii]|uniref:Uncharacterized protein n=1 Tax=Plasmopara halstedii TaxID=4781 RepID=A0A0N7L3W9_PLAHL|nr:uncharacterized protein PHALS_15016 [Plasmopara halstedii]CEG37043.1 hypothetical protein PHALS_15016 [Plasmopara halstedii]|eukprot:XP_024573412.1 hypothetical protein PHALS_15016 [Plasmopara halstedii]
MNTCFCRADNYYRLQAQTGFGDVCKALLTYFVRSECFYAPRSHFLLKNIVFPTSVLLVTVEV